MDSKQHGISPPMKLADKLRGKLLVSLFATAILFAITGLALVLGLSNGILHFSGNPNCTRFHPRVTPTCSASSSQQESLCLSQKCIRLAANYLNNMNSNVDPCKDFYSFGCGSYAISRAVPEHDKKFNVLNEMEKRHKLLLRDILEGSSPETESLSLPRTYYNSCMNEDAQDELGTLPMSSLISQMGGWELLTNARFDGADYHWEEMAGRLQIYGVDGLVKIFVGRSFEDRNEHLLMFCPPELFLEKKKFYRGAPSTNEYLSYYRQYIRSVLEMLGADMEDEASVIEYQVNDIIDLERRIANLSTHEGIRNHSSLDNLMTYGELRERYPEILWNLFFNEELIEILGPIEDDMKVNLYDMNYFEGLSALVKSKPLSSINNYMMFRLVSAFDMYLSQEYRHPRQQFHASMYGKTAEAPHWESCVDEVVSYLSMPLATALSTKYFSSKDWDKAAEMIEDLKNSMNNLLSHAEWMDEETRTAALKKLASMGYKIGFPKEINNITEVLRPFKGVHLAEDRYFDNALELRKAAVRENLNDLKRRPGIDQWTYPVIAVDAFYSFGGNEIIFPASILQYPMFAPEAPFYVNYASIGIAIGHEITHGYDDLGAQYDANGSLRGWWNDDTLETFQQRRQCFVSQYGSQVEPVTQKSVDGRVSIGENIADNGGIRVAYEAFKMRSSREEDLNALPGLTNFTAEQLFFLAYANVWCEVVKTSSVDYIMETDAHPLGMFRVNVPLQNFPPFSEAFNCPVGSPMNPFEKCRVW
uniref:Peptidase M13 domain containing protein n=1 Tax=Haemonchus contortus TaxID=6289 RepID=A0A7I4Y0V5_HAECO|nr:Peptidase M13 domain containing protein [Haemonchus contortus]